MSRPTKLTPETQEKITDAVSIGATYELAAKYAGVTYETFNNWMKAGAEAKSGQLFEFFHAVKKAEGAAAVGWLAVIEKAATETWQAAAWKLERRYPREYGRQVTEHTGEVTQIGMTLEEWQQRQAERRKQVAETLAHFDEAEAEGNE